MNKIIPSNLIGIDYSNIRDGRCIVCGNSIAFCNCDLSGEICEVCGEDLYICIRLEDISIANGGGHNRLGR